MTMSRPVRRSAHPLSRRVALFGSASAALCAAAPALAHDYTLGVLKIIHPWSRATPGGAKVAAGYLTVSNTGSTPDRLVSVAALVAGRVEIHEMAMTDGVMRMRELPSGVAVPAGGSVKLEPGGYHLMLMDLKQPLKQGDRFAATLTFERAGKLAVEFWVQAMGGDKPHH